VHRNRHLCRKRQSASQSTNASQTSKCLAIDISTQNAYNFLPACVAIDKCVAKNVKVRRNRQVRRKRQSASQSRFASQTSKCVAIDNCRLAKRRICLNRHLSKIASDASRCRRPRRPLVLPFWDPVLGVWRLPDRSLVT
jgi:hypothetical protein